MANSDGEDTASKPLTLTIKDQQGQEVQFKVKPHIKLGKVRARVEVPIPFVLFTLCSACLVQAATLCIPHATYGVFTDVCCL